MSSLNNPIVIFINLFIKNYITTVIKIKTYLTV